MRTLKYIFLSIIVAVFFTGCGIATTQITKGEYYPNIYKHHPASILVLPAKNTTTSVDAARLFTYTITEPLAERGYYVFPVHLVDAFFKSENLPNATLIRKIPIKKLKDIFGADAILYVDINAWDTGYKVISSNVDVGISFSLIDANSGNELWSSEAYAYSYEGLDFSSLGSLIVSAVSTAINTGTDYGKLAYVANKQGLSMLPYGKYHPLYKKDINDKLTFFDNAKLKDGKLYVNKYFIFGNNKKGKVALTVRGHQKGYFAFTVNNLNYFNHNGYSHYYVYIYSNGKKYLRNRFFKYENHRPYLLADNKKVFVYTKSDGTIPYSQDDDGYYFQIIKIVKLNN